MSKKLKYIEVSYKLNAFTDSIRKTYDDRNGHGYAYCVGYLKAIISELVGDLPAKKQIEFFKSLDCHLNYLNNEKEV